jgi:hypothetical protein
MDTIASKSPKEAREFLPVRSDFFRERIIREADDTHYWSTTNSLTRFGSSGKWQCSSVSPVAAQHCVPSGCCGRPLTKRALLGGEGESLTLKGRGRAACGKSAGGAHPAW